MNNKFYKLLVVDDDESVRQSLSKLLQGEGYQVTTVANGVEAVEIFCGTRNQIDLLLVDLNMPLKNGWATMDRLLEFKPSLPILIVTGLTNQYAMAEAAGVRALVEKPIDVASLLQLINHVLADSASSCNQSSDIQTTQFQFVRAAGYASRETWKEQRGTPYHHGGLNE